MLKYYFLLFGRNLQRQKLFSIINILGLSTGMASALLMYLYVSSELSHDRFHEKADRIYRVNQTFIWGVGGNKAQFSSTGPGVMFALEAEIPEVEQIVRINTPGDFLMSYTTPKGEVKSFGQGKVFATDSNFFKVFTFPLLKGNPETALRYPQTMVMTESASKKYFDGEDPLGKMIRVGEGDQAKNYEVTGVVKDIPDNSYIKFDVMLSMTSFPIVKRMSWSWIWTQVETFMLLKPGSSEEAVRARLTDIPKTYAAPSMKAAMNMTYDEYIKSGKEWKLYLQPLTEIHLPKTVVYNRLNDIGNIKIVYALIAAGIVMVLLSCINFMNLSTSQYVRKAKDTSLRKLLGSARSQLGTSFFIEAFLYCVISLLIGICIAQLILPTFNLITNRALELNLFTDWKILAALGSLLLIMSLLSGIYPALFLSAFNPVEALKGKLKSGKEGRALRSSMVVFQFTISMVLVILTGLVSQQLKYMSEKDIGFERENLLQIDHVEWAKGREAFVDAIVQIPGVANASWTTSVPPRVFGGDSFRAKESDKTIPINFSRSDENYLPTLGVSLKYGRNFRKDMPGDSARVILNETAVVALGWKVDESVIGKKIIYPGQDNAAFEVVGVTNDYHFWALNSPIEPMAVFHPKGYVYQESKHYLVIRMNAQNRESLQASIESIKNKWKEFTIDKPFEFSFVDENFANAFKSADQFNNSLAVLSALAILIAVLGLLGMTIHTIEQRTKEMGIRKVSGASVSSLVLLISRDYSRLIIIAFIFSAPLAYWVVQQWLEEFQYRITPSPLIFLAVGGGTLLLAGLITSYHSIRAAMRNPVEVLRDE
ncbi:MAG TPA: ABC transporter permease [Cyclobacteriaceae bacterium]|nr:ABC transporter permease [Cyclobacteriaceae bacterium]